MSKVWVTNESSSFAKSFDVWCESQENHRFLNRLSNKEYDYFRQDNMFRGKEIDIFDPTLSKMIQRSGAEVIIHQLPITPDKSILHTDFALRHNIEGSQCIIAAAKSAGIPVIFITSMNYGYIKSNYKANRNSDIYDITALTVENLLDSSGIAHTSIVPPMLYGPEFDEGVSGLIKTAINRKEISILNIDPEIKHSFMHIDDFFDALSITIDYLDLEENKVDFDVLDFQPDKKITVGDILDKLQDQDFFLAYEFHPENDYGSISAGTDSIYDMYKWKPKYNIDTGLEDVIDKMRNK